MKRSTGLRSDPEKTFAWRRRSRKPIPVVSARRKAEKPQRDATVAAVKERDGGCQAAFLFDTDCAGPFDTHEVIRRSAWSGGHLVEANCLLLCRLHHEAVTTNPLVAEGLGLSRTNGMHDRWLAAKAEVLELGRFPYPGSRP